MKDHPDVSTSYLFCPPTDDAAAWRLSLDRFADSLACAFPGALTHRRPTGFRGGSVLEFEVGLEGGLRARGIVTVPVEECGAVTVVDASCEAAALFARWLRDSFAPSPDLIRFSSELALESGDDSHWSLPTTGEVDGIESAIHRHLRSAAHG